MNIKLEYIILFLVIMAIRIPTGSSIKQELCFWNTLNATCAENEVMQMEHAQYGRMSVGSCIQENDAYNMGCMRDVLSYMDSVCSGRQWCQLKLPDEQLATENEPCPRMMSYLQLQYSCVQVLISPTPCTGNPLIVTRTKGMLSNYITGRTGHGSFDCPWEVRGSPGQKIRLTLHDYGLWTPPKAAGDRPGVRGTGIRQADGAGTCPIYARITEGEIKRSITLCGGEARNKIVYISEAEGVQIFLTDPKHSHSPKYFLLQYEAIGCPTYKPPEGAVVEKHGNDIVVKCSNTGIETIVSCDGNNWISEAVNKCNASDGHSLSMGALVKGVLTLPLWILIVIIIVAAAIIAVPILVVGIISFRKRNDAVLRSAQTPNVDTVKRLPDLGNYAKENDLMLDKYERSRKSLQGREYTSTADRHGSVRPDVVTPSGGFPPLPLPPTSSYLGKEGSFDRKPSHECHPWDSNRSTLQRPHPDHKYESPKALRRTRSTSDASDPFYRELGSVHPDLHSTSQLEYAESDTESLGMDTPVPLSPGVFIGSSYGS